MSWNQTTRYETGMGVPMATGSPMNDYTFNTVQPTCIWGQAPQPQQAPTELAQQAQHTLLQAILQAQQALLQLQALPQQQLPLYVPQQPYQQPQAPPRQLHQLPPPPIQQQRLVQRVQTQRRSPPGRPRPRPARKQNKTTNNITQPADSNGKKRRRVMLAEQRMRAFCIMKEKAAKWGGISKLVFTGLGTKFGAARNSMQDLWENRCLHQEHQRLEAEWKNSARPRFPTLEAYISGTNQTHVFKSRQSDAAAARLAAATPASATQEASELEEAMGESINLPAESNSRPGNGPEPAATVLEFDQGTGESQPLGEPNPQPALDDNQSFVLVETPPTDMPAAVQQAGDSTQEPYEEDNPPSRAGDETIGESQPSEKAGAPPAVGLLAVASKVSDLEKAIRECQPPASMSENDPAETKESAHPMMANDVLAALVQRLSAVEKVIRESNLQPSVSGNPRAATPTTAKGAVPSGPAAASNVSEHDNNNPTAGEVAPSPPAGKGKEKKRKAVDADDNNPIANSLESRMTRSRKKQKLGSVGNSKGPISAQGPPALAAVPGRLCRHLGCKLAVEKGHGGQPNQLCRKHLRTEAKRIKKRFDPKDVHVQDEYPDGHNNMSKDNNRNRFYGKGIAKALRLASERKKGETTVVDLGTGSDMCLSQMVAKHAIKRWRVNLIAIESDEQSYKAAQRSKATLNMENLKKLDLQHASSYQFRLDKDQKIDVVVHDIFGHLASMEGFVPVFVDLIQRNLLDSNSKSVPSRAETRWMPVVLSKEKRKQIPTIPLRWSEEVAKKYGVCPLEDVEGTLETYQLEAFDEHWAANHWNQQHIKEIQLPRGTKLVGFLLYLGLECSHSNTSLFSFDTGRGGGRATNWTARWVPTPIYEISDQPLSIKCHVSHDNDGFLPSYAIDVLQQGKEVRSLTFTPDDLCEERFL